MVYPVLPECQEGSRRRAPGRSHSIPEHHQGDVIRVRHGFKGQEIDNHRHRQILSAIIDKDGEAPLVPSIDAYIRGRSHWYKLTPQDLETALQNFELALEIDPNYALAHTEIALVWAGRYQTITVYWGKPLFFLPFHPFVRPR